MYRLLDTGQFQKLEQVGPYRLVRPAAQAVWRPRLPQKEWEAADATYQRLTGGDGRWHVRKKGLPEQWTIDAQAVGKFVVRLTDFGHLGIFPEQHANWQALEQRVREARVATGKSPLVLNLFAYTGGSSLACARGGAQVVHVDASKTSVAWARDNAQASGLADRPIRWLVDDAVKLVQREVRRGSQYHGIILDPPSYGRGPQGESWKIEEMLPPLVDDLVKLLAPDFSFVLLSSHSAGYSPLALTNLLRAVAAKGAGQFRAAEMVVHEDGPDGRPLPSGSECWFLADTRP